MYQFSGYFKEFIMVKKSFLALSLLLVPLGSYAMDTETIKKSLPEIIKALRDEGYIIEQESFFSRHKLGCTLFGGVCLAGAAYYVIKHYNKYASKKDLATVIEDVMAHKEAKEQVVNNRLLNLQAKAKRLAIETETANSESISAITISEQLKETARKIVEHDRAHGRTIEESLTNLFLSLETTQEAFNNGSNLLAAQINQPNYQFLTALSLFDKDLIATQRRIELSLVEQSELLVPLVAQTEEQTQTTFSLREQTASLAQISSERSDKLSALQDLVDSMEKQKQKRNELTRQALAFNKSCTLPGSNVQPDQSGNKRTLILN